MPSQSDVTSTALGLSSWTGPFGGVPPFATVAVRDFAPALEAAMLEKRREIDAIANNPAPPTFANTIAAIEDAGRAFTRVETIYGVWSSAMSAPEFQSLERDLAPKLAAFSDEITQNPKLFDRVERVYLSPEKDSLTAEEQRLTWRIHSSLLRAGAKLDATSKGRLSSINQRLALLYTTFSQNVLADEEQHAVVLENEAELEGLPASVRSVAAAAAVACGLSGKWVITNTRSSVEPFLTYSTRRDLREKAWRSFVSRGDHGGAHDNNAIVSEILRLRAERATLLGYPSHAHYSLENTMAKTPERAMQLMERVWPLALERVRQEVSDMQAIAGSATIQPWDYRYWAEKVRKAKYDLDEDEVKAYLELEQLREAMFWVAGELFHLDFALVSNVPVYHPDVRVWEIRDRVRGAHIGLFYFDPYARPGKHSGAWMNEFRSQERFRTEISPIISNNANFVKPKNGEPTLISWGDARTLFHEFGHALHGLCSNVRYPSVSGTNVRRDYVELPSQLFEHWLSTPELLSRFALHHQTGRPMPDELQTRIHNAATFNQGFLTIEYLSAAIVDMKLHMSTEREIDPTTFEHETLCSIGMPNEVVMRHRIPHFSHVFGGDGYAAGYYAYLWADTLAADAFAAFGEAAGPYDRAVSGRLRMHVLSTGDAVDPELGYRAFRGRDPEIAALLTERGFATSD